MMHLIPSQRFENGSSCLFFTDGQFQKHELGRGIQPAYVIDQAKKEYLLTVVRQIPPYAAKATEPVVQTAGSDADRRVLVLHVASIEIRHHTAAECQIFIAVVSAERRP